MPVRRIKPDNPIVALDRNRDIIDVTPSPKAAGDAGTTCRTPEEAAAIQEIWGSMKRQAISSAWLDEQERIAREIMENSDLLDFTSFLEILGNVQGGRIIRCEHTWHPSGSPPWYAERIIGRIHYLRRMEKAFLGDGRNPTGEEPADVRQNLWRVLDAAFQLGSICREARINNALGKPLQTGLKQSEHLRASSGRGNARKRARANADHNRWRGAAKEIWGRRPDLTVTACSRLVIKQLGLSAALKTVSDRIRDLKKVGEAR
jgi:hypothetical protein